MKDKEIILKQETKNISNKSGWQDVVIDGKTYTFYFADNKITFPLDGEHNGVAKCHPEDIFDEIKGCKLALARTMKNLAEDDLKETEKLIEEAQGTLDDLMESKLAIGKEYKDILDEIGKLIN